MDADTATLYELFGLDSTADVAVIKHAYRYYAKIYHPDKNLSANAKAIFQKLNAAYQTLTNNTLRAEYDSSIGVRPPNSTPPPRQSEDCAGFLMPDLSLDIRENACSMTIDITDIMFLVLLEQCKSSYDCEPIDRGHQGIQIRCQYHSPDDSSAYGSLSLTFYGSTSRLLVQGSSYILWYEEHLPGIYSKAQDVLTGDLGKWSKMAKKLGIGISRHRVSTRSGKKADISSPIAELPVNPLSFSSRHMSHTHNFIPVIDDVTQSETCSPFQDHALETPVSPVSPNGGSSVPHSTGGALAIDHVQHVPSSETPHADMGPAIFPDAMSSEGDKSELGGSAFTPEHKGLQTESSKTKITTVKPKTKQSKLKAKPDTKNKTGAAQPPSPPQCMENCKIKRVGERVSEIRCILCMIWYHNICVNEDDDYIGSWACSDCRLLPRNVSKLQAQLAEVSDTLHSMKGTENTLKTENNRLKQRVECLQETNTTQAGLLQSMLSKDEAQALKDENNRLRQKVQSITTKHDDLVKIINTMSDGPYEVPTKSRHVTRAVDTDSASPRDTETASKVIITVPTYNAFQGLSDTAWTDIFTQLNPRDRVPDDSGSYNVPSFTDDTEDATDGHENIDDVSGSDVSNDTTDDSGSHVDRNESAVSEDETGDKSNQDNSDDDAATELKPVKVSVVGSSIARGVSILVHKSTEFDAMGWVYPGRTASQINSRLERLPLTEVTVIQAGTNDIQSKSVEECKHAIKEVVSTAANHPERKTIIMCTIPQ